MIERLRRLLSRLAGREVARRETLLLLAAIGAGLALRVAYVLATYDHMLAGDEPEYYLEGLRATQGKWFWTDRPFDIPHAGMWKSPGYPAFVGVAYVVFGVGVGKLLMLQTVLLGPIAIVLIWLLARRLFDSRVATVAAFAGALYPHMWQWEAGGYTPRRWRCRSASCCCCSCSSAARRRGSRWQSGRCSPPACWCARRRSSSSPGWPWRGGWPPACAGAR